MTPEPRSGQNKPGTVHVTQISPSRQQITFADTLRRLCTLWPKSIISHTFAGNFREFMGTHAGTSGLSGSTFPLRSPPLENVPLWLPDLALFFFLMHPCMKPLPAWTKERIHIQQRKFLGVILPELLADQPGLHSHQSRCLNVCLLSSTNRMYSATSLRQDASGLNNLWESWFSPGLCSVMVERSN